MVRALTALCLAVPVAISGCGGAERVRDVYYSLQPSPAVSPSTRPIPGTVRVSPLAARGFVGGSRIVYRTADEPLEVKRYDEYLWEELPARALADAMQATLRASRVFENVVGPGDPARPDYLLTGELLRFEHLPTDNPPRVAAELTLTLVDARTRALLASKVYSGFEPTAGADGRTTPTEMVSAFNRLSGRLIAEAAADVRSVAPRLR